jgi:MoxR-like ATPase
VEENAHRIGERLKEVCERRRLVAAGSWPVGLGAPAAIDLKDSLQALATLLEDALRDGFWALDRIRVFVGQGSLARVLWIALLPPDQEPNEGIYVGLCLDAQGRGVLAGLMKSATLVPGIPIPTVRRTPLAPDDLDVDGTGPTLRFNNRFHNPMPFLAEADDGAGLLAHLRASLNLCQELLAEGQPDGIYYRPRRPRHAAVVRESRRVSYNATLRLDALVPAARAALESGGLHLSDTTLRRLCAALIARPLVLLAGLSGSGKTRAALGLARWLAPQNVTLVAVGADWTGREPILGYADALDPTRYVRTPALERLLAAAVDPQHPHFLILDEMNLSPAERYLADLLSAMESGEPLALHGDPQPRDGVPAQLLLPKNLFVLGTVNSDETTHLFSLRVLDRACVVPFHIENLAALLAAPQAIRPDVFVGQGQAFAPLLLAAAHAETMLPDVDRAVLAERIARLADMLAAHDAGFGLRTAYTLMRLASAHAALTRSVAGGAALDDALLLKLLPRLSGDVRFLEPLLSDLRALCADLPDTRAALTRMQRRLARDGATGFFEG